MKRAFFIITVFLILSCSSDDDSNSSSSQNFFEKYDGIVWQRDDEGMQSDYVGSEILRIKFINGNPIQVVSFYMHVGFSEECNKGTLPSSIITDVTEDSFSFEEDGEEYQDESGNPSIMTFTAIDNGNKLIQKNSLDPGYRESWSSIDANDPCF